MNKKSVASQILTLFLLAVGVLIGTALVGIATWGDMEMVFFFPASTADKSLSNLQCPILISKSETGLVSVNLKNSSTYTVTPITRITISQGSTIITQDFSNQPTIPPGTTQKISWQVNASEAAYRGSLIMVEVYVTRSYPLPSRSNTCGIVVMNLGALTGNEVVIGTICLSIAAMLLGTILWMRYNKTTSGQRDTFNGGLISLEVLVLAGIGASLLALWLAGLIIFLFSILLIVILISRFGVDVRG